MNALSLSEPTGLAFMFAGLFLGAILKGAAGAGLPIIAIPTIAAIYDVRVAVVLLVIPNFITNIYQISKHKEHNLKNNFARKFAIAGFIGAGLGTLLLAYLPLQILNVLIAIVVFLYIVLRLLRPEFSLAIELMQKWALTAGTCAGVLQGAIGLSSPITITFLHSGRFGRRTFIYIASLFFASMSLVQFPLQAALGLLTWELALLSMLTLIPIVIGLPIGEWVGRRLDTVVFDRIILIMLSALGIKMLFDSGLFSA